MTNEQLRVFVAERLHNIYSISRQCPGEIAPTIQALVDDALEALSEITVKA